MIQFDIPDWRSKSSIDNLGLEITKRYFYRSAFEGKMIDMLKKALLLSVSVVGITAVISLIIIGNFLKTTLVRFESEPKANVYVDGVSIGQTPIEFETRKRFIKVKFQAQSVDSYLPYETALSLTPQTKVIVRRNLGKDNVVASGQIFQFQKITKNDAEMTFVTNPANSYVFVDDVLAGVSPLTLSSPDGIKSVKIIKDGYTEQSFKLQTTVGYNILTSVDLTLLPPPTEVKTSQIATILKTPYGFLYVRKSPTEIAPDIARVFSDREYEVLGFSDDKSWANIKLNASESGWIRTQYATVSAQIATPP